LEFLSKVKKGLIRTPDLIIQKGDLTSLYEEELIKKLEEDFLKNKSVENLLHIAYKLYDSIKGKIDLLIECKHLPYEMWEKDVENQILVYKEVYQPKYMVVISAYQVPKNVEELLKKNEIEVLYPCGFGEFSYECKEKLKSILLSL